MNEHEEEIIKKQYEIGFILQDPEAETALAKVLSEYKVDVVHKSPLKETKLAYAIKKKEFAYFGFYQFSAPGDAVGGISKALMLVPGVLRFLIVTPPPKVTEETKQPETPRPSRDETKTVPSSPVLTNEALEEKLEEILQ